MNELMRDAQRSKSKILDSAEQLFAAKGFNNTSLAEIGAHSKLSRATPAYYFQNKATLYQAVLTRLMDDERDFVQRMDLLESAEIVGRVRELLCAHIDFIFQRPTYVPLICREALDNNGFLLSTNSFLTVVKQGKELIELAHSRGLLASKDTDSILMYSLSVAWFPFLQKDLIAKSLNINAFSSSFLQRHKDFVTTTFIQSLF